MKLDSKTIAFDSLCREMRELKEKQHYDYLVTIVG